MRLILTCAKFDCFDGSFMFCMPALNCRLRVTDRASFANLDKPKNSIFLLVAR